jgi:hypothetical protein
MKKSAFLFLAGLTFLLPKAFAEPNTADDDLARLKADQAYRLGSTSPKKTPTSCNAAGAAIVFQAGDTTLVKVGDGIHMISAKGKTCQSSFNGMDEFERAARISSKLKGVLDDAKNCFVGRICKRGDEPGCAEVVDNIRKQLRPKRPSEEDAHDPLEEPNRNLDPSSSKAQ